MCFILWKHIVSFNTWKVRVASDHWAVISLAGGLYMHPRLYLNLLVATLYLLSNDKKQTFLKKAHNSLLSDFFLSFVHTLGNVALLILLLTTSHL